MPGWDGEIAYFTEIDTRGVKPRANQMTTNGQLLIGSTATPHIKVGSITSPMGTLAIGYNSPNLTLDLVGGISDLHVAKLIVNPLPNAGGNYTTITAALAAAVSGDTIFVMPATYTENLTLKAGVNICAFDCDAQTPNVTIVGKCTATFSGTCSISGIRLQTNSDNLLAVSGANTTNVNLIDCYINASNNTAIACSSTGSTIRLTRCRGDIGATGAAYFAFTAGVLRLQYCSLMNTTGTTTSTFATGSTTFLIEYTNLLNSISTADSNTFQAIQSQITGTTAVVAALTLNGSGSTSIDLSYVNGGSLPAISVGAACSLTIANSEISSSNTNAIAGAGAISYAGLSFISSSSKISTTTQTVLNGGPSATFSSSNSGATNTLTVSNSSNTASSNALQQVTVAGTSAGDAFTTYTVSGTTNWSQGVDNSVTGDPFVLAASTALGTTNVMSVATTGELTFPLQSSFLAVQESAATNATGDGTAYVLGTTTDLVEIFDQNADFDPATGTFTAPADGIYEFFYGVEVQSVGAAHTQFQTFITTTGKTFLQNTCNPFVQALSGAFNVTGSAIINMASGNTATISVYVAGGAKTVTVFGAASPNVYTFFSGAKIA